MSPAASDLLIDGPASSDLTIVLAHGAGAPMDSPFMAAVATGLAGHGLRVARFEFPYMAKRRQDGTRRPPDRAPVLLQHWRNIIQALGAPRRLVVGGKSMGGRMASLIADEMAVAGLLVFGYPFHAPGKPPGERIAHLAALKTPALIVQGTRDSMGTRDDVAGYTLSKSIELCWIEDGDHSLKPRKKSGVTEEDALAAAIGAAADFAAGLRI
jgi:predicted alpha/beta-hydrolase family hydrolase